jgi:hypothetical protein
MAISAVLSEARRYRLSRASIRRHSTASIAANGVIADPTRQTWPSTARKKSRKRN